MKETDTHVSSSCMAAVYKGLRVAVYMVDKTEISLTRHDLVELVNVSLFFSLVHDCRLRQFTPTLSVE